MNFGYNYKIWAETYLKIPIPVPLHSHPNALITGASGSGKSYALLYLLGELVKEPGITIYFCDFKNSNDFAFMRSYKHFYAGDSCLDGLLEYYSIFQKARESGGTANRHILIFDEYPSAISRWSGFDKADKTKKADMARQAVADILMMGRGIGFGIWVVTQRPDSDLFKNGSRDNFMVILALGFLSKEQKAMVFPGLADEIPKRIPQVGEGLILADGKPLKTVKFPRFRNINGWKARIFSKLVT